MLDQLRQHLPERIARGADNSEDSSPSALSSLRFLAAEMLLVTGLGATSDVLSRTRVAQRDRIPGRPSLSRPPLAAVWGPALVAPLAAAAHIRHATTPGDATARASHVLDSAVVGIGVMELLTSAISSRRNGRSPSLVPLAFASAGLLGLILGHREKELERERKRLERRAAVVERLVPRARPRLHRVVVHV